VAAKPVFNGRGARRAMASSPRTADRRPSTARGLERDEVSPVMSAARLRRAVDRTSSPQTAGVPAFTVSAAPPGTAVPPSEDEDGSVPQAAQHNPEAKQTKSSALTAHPRPGGLRFGIAATPPKPVRPALMWSDLTRRTRNGCGWLSTV
jgi:hypothetical protein